jgi:hypothetical protein
MSICSEYGLKSGGYYVTGGIMNFKKGGKTFILSLRSRSDGAEHSLIKDFIQSTDRLNCFILDQVIFRASPALL